MRTWKTCEDLELLDRFLSTLRETKRLEPGGTIAGDPVNLQGLVFPTVTMCKELELSTVVASRISGSQKFYDVTLKRVDFSEARLDFSVWNDCRFEEVCFDRAKLCNVRFFGCTFGNCTFRSTLLSDASFSVGRIGAETEISDTVFESARFGGASCHNLVLRNCRFVRCKFGSFVFESPLCDHVEFVGRYKQLTFRGMPRDPERNRLRIDLTKTWLCWLNANHGLDLSWVRVPADGSCMVIADRLKAVEVLAEQLDVQGSEAAKKVATLLRKLYTDRSISPLSQDQTTFLLSRAMIEDFAGDAEQGAELFEKIRSIAEEEGFLAKARD